MLVKFATQPGHTSRPSARSSQQSGRTASTAPQTPESQCCTHRRIVVFATLRPRSLIIATKSRKLSLKLKYQRTFRTTIFYLSRRSDMSTLTYRLAEDQRKRHRDGSGWGWGRTRGRGLLFASIARSA